MLFKAILLGVGYGMGEDSLALRLTAAAIDSLSEDDRKKLLSGEDKTIIKQIEIIGKDGKFSYPKAQRAEYYLDLYRKIFHRYEYWKEETYLKYRHYHVLKLSDGWRRIGMDGNRTSVCNFPIQGEGQAMLRKAVSLCLDRGLKVITTLHDAIYIETNESNREHDLELLNECMLAAGGGLRVAVHEQKIDWQNFKSDWSDEKGFEEFARFGKYFLKKFQ